MSRASLSAFAGCAPSSSFESSPSPSAASPPPIRSRRDVLELRRPLAHLTQRVLVGVEAELRDEPQAAHDPQRVVPEARRARRAEDTALEVGAAAERIEHLAGLEPPRDRVDREVAALHVLLERDSRVGDDLEVVAARPGRALDARRRELDPRRLRAPGPPCRAAAGARPRAGRRRSGPRRGRAARARRATRRDRLRERRSRAPERGSRAARHAPPRRRRRRRARASARSRRPSSTRRHSGHEQRYLDARWIAKPCLRSVG